MVWVRLKQVAFYTIEFIIFGFLAFAFIALVYIGDFGPMTIAFPFLFGLFRSLIFGEKAVSIILVRNLVIVLFAYLAVKFPSVNYNPDLEWPSGYFQEFLENLAVVTIEPVLGALGAYLLLCCGNVTGKSLRSSYPMRRKNYAFPKIRKETVKKTKKLKANESIEPSDSGANADSDDSDIDISTWVDSETSAGKKGKKPKKSPEEVDREFELHKKRIELIGGYLTAFQPLFVFLTGIIGSVLMYLGTR